VLLSDKTIMEYINTERIRVEPRPDMWVALGSCSLDLRLGTQIHVLLEEGTMTYDLTDFGPRWQRYWLQPGDFVLASTAERVSLPDTVAGRLEGRSSLARMGWSRECASAPSLSS
jgi:dCTP deaminase